VRFVENYSRANNRQGGEFDNIQLYLLSLISFLLFLTFVRYFLSYLQVNLRMEVCLERCGHVARDLGVSASILISCSLARTSLFFLHITTQY